MRVNAGREPSLGPTLGHALRAPPVLLVGDVENAERAVDAGRPGPVDDRVEIGRERVIGQVAVGVDHVGLAGLKPPYRPVSSRIPFFAISP